MNVVYMKTGLSGLDGYFQSAIESQRARLQKLMARSHERTSVRRKHMQQYEQERENGFLRLKWVVAFQECIAFEREVWHIGRKQPWRAWKKIPEREKAALRERVLAAEKCRMLCRYEAKLTDLRLAHRVLKFQLSQGSK